MKPVMGPAPEFGGSMDARYVSGLARLEDRMLIIVDFEVLLASAEMVLVEAADAA